jgi:cytochrome c553
MTCNASSPSLASLRSAPSPRFAGRGKSALVVTAVLWILVPAPEALAAGNVTTGRQKALQCQTCHGLDGLSKLPEAPNLGGQPEPYLVKSLNDFRKGVRKNDMMSLVVQQLSDQDVADLAAFYAAIELTTKPPK